MPVTNCLLQKILEQLLSEYSLHLLKALLTARNRTPAQASVLPCNSPATVSLVQCTLGSWEVLLTPSGYWANWCNLINPLSSYPLAHTIFPGEICHSFNKYQLTAVLKMCPARSGTEAASDVTPACTACWVRGESCELWETWWRQRKGRNRRTNRCNLDGDLNKAAEEGSHVRLRVIMLSGASISVIRDCQPNKNSRSRRKRLTVDCIMY